MIQTALAGIDGVQAAYVDHASGTAKHRNLPAIDFSHFLFQNLYFSFKNAAR